LHKRKINLHARDRVSDRDSPGAHEFAGSKQLSGLSSGCRRAGIAVRLGYCPALW
jgi:hypothetical protein